MTFVGDVLPLIGTLVGIAGTVATGVAARNQGQFQQQVANRNAEIAKQNAEIANANAVKTINVAQENQEASDNETAALVGEQLANQGASGLAATSRSFVLTRKRAKELGVLDSLRIRQQGEEGAGQYRQQAKDYINQSVDYENQGTMARTAGNNAFTGSLINVGGSLVGAATSTNWKKFGSSGTPSQLKTKDPWVTNRGVNLRRVGA